MNRSKTGPKENGLTGNKKNFVDGLNQGMSGGDQLQILNLKFAIDLMRFFIS
jgi:hypothetical protein